MTLIEQLFGISPDGGNGFIEAGLFAIAISLCILFLCQRFRRQSNGTE